MRGLAVNRTALVFILIGSLAVSPGQNPEKPKLNILVIGGEGSINNVKQRVAREPVVQVTDENDRPVAGAIVLFRLPNSGASGTFTANQSNVISVTTGADGRASARFIPNQAEGQLQIQVTASYQGVTATSVINMTNATAPIATTAGIGAGKLLAIVAAVGAAAAVGIVAGTRGGNGGQNPPPASPTTITAGAGNVGPRP